MKETIRHSGRSLILVLIAGVFLLSGMYALRIHQTANRQDKLCEVLHSLVARSGATVGKPGTPGYTYYHGHPDELALARKQNREFLEKLPC